VKRRRRRARRPYGETAPSMKHRPAPPGCAQLTQ
jgi:hypothetical protein